MTGRVKIKKVVGLLVFISLVCTSVLCLNHFFQPDFGVENNYMGKKAFDEEPENTVEALIIGSSCAHHGVSVMEMYEEHGICAWNLGSSLQPVSSSYYLLEDAYRMHPETLKTVFFEIFSIEDRADPSLRRSINDALKDIRIKYRANRDFSEDDKEAIDYTVPLISYHTRWKEISNEDFNKSKKKYRPYMRGYFLDTKRDFYDAHEVEELPVPHFNPDISAGEAKLDPEGMYYLKKMIDFCGERGIRLILFKTPMSNHWDDTRYNAMKSIADSYGLTYLDFNYEPLFDEMHMNMASDLDDTDHLNYYGVKKLSAWIGDYLAEDCGAHDVRGKEGYEHLEDELVKYKEKAEDLVALRSINDPAEYIEAALKNTNYSVMITVKDDAVSSLTADQREVFSRLGLVKLSELGFRDSYIGVVDPASEMLHEQTEKDPPEEEDVTDEETNLEVMRRMDLEDVREEEAKNGDYDTEETDAYKAIEYSGNFRDGGYYTLKSGGSNLGNTSSMVINGEEFSADHRGLNIVIYDNELHEVADIADFDTCSYPERLGNDIEAELNKALAEDTDPEHLPGELEKLYYYNQMCDEARSEKEAVK